jgi:hypothetical protein
VIARGRSARGSSENFLTAPKDGSVFNVQFSGGEATKARWNSQAAEFEVLRETGEWVKMTYDRGTANTSSR